MKRRTWLLVSLLPLLAAAALPGCKSPAAGAAEEKELAKTVRAETVGREDIEEVLRYVADLQPFAEVRVFSPVPDRILWFPWQDGDSVRRGQRIALIRREGMDKGLEQIQAQIDALDAQIGNLESEIKRGRDLLAAGVITQSVFDRSRTAYLAALAQRKGLEAGKGQLTVSADNAVLNAAIGGVIASKALEPGDLAGVGIPLCRILQVDKLKVALRLVEADVPKVVEGQEVQLRLDAWPKRVFVGKITTILPYLDAGSRTNTVEVTIENPVDADRQERLLKPGMFGRAEIVVDRRTGVLVAPEPALLLDNRLLERSHPGEILRKAFVVDAGGLARRREVRLGARKGSLYEVLDGLAEGERVVVRGQHQLKDGQPVQVVAATAE